MAEVPEVDCGAFLLDDVLLEVQGYRNCMLVPLELVLEVVELEVMLLVVLP